MKFSLAFAIVLFACGLEGSSLDSSPYALTAHLVKRSPQNNRATSRFITGNSQIDSAAVGAAIGALASYGQSQVFGSPCNRNTR